LAQQANSDLILTVQTVKHDLSILNLALQRKLRKRMLSRSLKLAFALLVGTIVAFAVLVIRRLVRRSPDELQAHTDDPATDYERAMARFAEMLAQEKEIAAFNPVCPSKLLTHGQKMERAIILMHGMTNCPEQYAALAPLFFERGYNVLVPLMPGNGLMDPDTEALKDVTAEQLRDCSNSAVDIGRGLGDHLTFAGISIGGTLAAWVAQNRDDVDQAVLIAPAFTIARGMGVRLSRLVMHLFLVMPNIMTQRFRPFTGAVGHNYHGFATRGLGQAMRLGFSVYDAARTTKPAAQSVIVVTNAADLAVDNGITQKLVDRWRAAGLDRVETCELDASYHLIHDVIDPNQKEQQTALVYPILLDLIAPPIEG
jgi:alpha-beta hydrolase superfamily lysophospholipase